MVDWLDTQNEGDIEYFKYHNLDGVRILQACLPYLSDSVPEIENIALYLLDVNKWMKQAHDPDRIQAVYETAMKAYEQAELLINSEADRHQILSMKSSFFNRSKIDHSAMVRYLCRQTERLEATMNFRLVPAGDGDIPEVTYETNDVETEPEVKKKVK